MRRSLAVLPLVVVPVSLALGGAADGASSRSVRVGDNWFERSSGVPTVRVARNTTVRFRWVGDAPHNVTVTRGPVRFRSRTQSSGRYARRVTRRGTYRIVCTVHGADDMSMRLVVR